MICGVNMCITLSSDYLYVLGELCVFTLRVLKGVGHLVILAVVTSDKISHADM